MICLLRPLGAPPAAGLPILLACGLCPDACDALDPEDISLRELLRSMGQPLAPIASLSDAVPDDPAAAPMTLVACEGRIDAERLAGAIRSGRSRVADRAPAASAGGHRPDPVRVEVCGAVDAGADGPVGIEIIDGAGHVVHTIEEARGEPFEIAPTSRLRLRASGRRLTIRSPLEMPAVERLLEALEGVPGRLLEPESYERAREALARMDLACALAPIEPAILESWHTHTFHSACGLPEMDPLDILALAKDLGYEALAFTDHMVRGEDNVARILAVRERCEMARARGRAPARVLVGGEFEVLRPGRVWVPGEVADACDIIVVSPNHYHLRDVASPSPASIEDAAAHELAMLESAVRHPRTDVVAHPFVSTMQVFPADRLFDAADPSHLEDILAAARENDVAIEVSPKAFSMAAGDGIGSFYAMVREAGVAIAPGSDAHSLLAIRSWSVMFREIARVLSIERSDVWQGPRARVRDGTG
ncbi:MAG: hypothetical protein JXP34_26570 [Planctomycetes bacterium]|nr:hypothetical protein [Planctomycetota bacterium]